MEKFQIESSQKVLERSRHNRSVLDQPSSMITSDYTPIAVPVERPPTTSNTLGRFKKSNNAVFNY